MLEEVSGHYNAAICESFLKIAGQQTHWEVKGLMQFVLSHNICSIKQAQLASWASVILR